MTSQCTRKIKANSRQTIPRLVKNMGIIRNFSIGLVSTGFMIVASATQSLAVSLTYNSSIGRPATFQNGDFPGVPGTLAVPQGIGVQDSTGLIYISNGRGIDRVDVFDSKGNYVKGIGSTGKGPGQFDEPADLKFQPTTGDLHVGDVFNSRINVFDAQGNYKRSYASFGGPVEGRLFFGPGGMQFDKNGDLYITDFSTDVIKKYNGTSGDLIKTIGGPGSELGQFSGPAGLNISPNTGRIYVTDQYNGRVQVFDSNANPLFAFGSTGSAPGQFKEAIGIEVDEFENIYVADSQNSRVQVFDKDGKFLSSFGEPVRNASGEVVPPPVPAAQGGTTPYGNPLDLSPGKFNWAAGAHYDRGKLYVGDFFQGRVKVLDVKGQSQKVPEPASILGFTLLGVGAAATKFRKNKKDKVISVISPKKEMQKITV
jgi:DNA-binding beta-propeller fold protein YncE